MSTSTYSEFGLTAPLTSPSSVELKLAPKIHPQVQRFLKNPHKAYELVGALGSPLNLLFPKIVESNLKAFCLCFKNHKLRGKVFFAHKANRSHSLVRQLAAHQQAYIEVSSVAELRHALGGGFPAYRILASGPKSTEFLALSLMHNIALSVDSLWEISEILHLREYLNIGSATKLLLRISGFRSTHSAYQSKASRFGIPLDEVGKAFDQLQASARALSLLGFAFHIDTVSAAEKALAVENCLTLFEQAFDRGFEPAVLDLGGGFKVNYLDNGDDWNNYTTALRETVIGARAPITWHGDSFGLTAVKGVVHGSFNSYSYYDPIAGPQFLEEIFSYQLANLGDSSVASLLRGNGIELWIEPGRALLDQAGITLARVNSLQRSSHGDALVCLNMKRQDLCFVDQEVFADPVILYQEPGSNESPPVPVYFVGNLCLEGDIICKHQIFVPALPKPGDIVAFINTAGYFMDFSASEAVMQPIAQKVAVFEREDKFAWAADDHYHPWLASTGKQR